jgi:Patatin-like phospholipase
VSTEPAWPPDIPIAEPPKRGAFGFLRWIWMPAKNSAGPSQPLLFQRPRDASSPPRTGICCSGGGLRSAAFSFGALDVLWREGIIEKSDYLAGVSGGSYAVAAATVVRAQSDGTEWNKDEPGPYGLGSPELDYLRNRTNYLAPGLMGRWNMFLRLILGIVLNLAVILGVLFVIGRLGGRFYRWALPELGRCAGHACDGRLTFHRWSGIVILSLVGAGLAAGLLDLLFRPAADWWWRRLVRWCGTFVFLAIIAAVVLRVVPQLLWWARTSRIGYRGDASQFTRGAGSVAAAVASFALSIGHLVFRSGSGGKGSLPGKLAKVPRKFRTILQKVTVGFVVPLSLVVFFLIAVDSGTRRWTSRATWWWAAILVLVAAVFAFGNPITWSAQPFYKRRLRTVFALKRTTGSDGRVTVGPVAAVQEPKLSELRPEQWPELLICAAANVSDLGYTPPGLGVTSFVFSPDRIGGPLVGSIPTAVYEQRLTRIRLFQKVWNKLFKNTPSTGRLRDVSPLSAVSISGAAVSPSMGRMTQPAYRMLIAMLNLRLGVWLANPRLVNRLEDVDGVPPTFKPLVRPTYLLRELFGQNNLHRKFLYVSDGGHYENLGLVELLRRGCTTIYAVDASGDTPGTIRTLGQAVALARSELGIEFDDIDPAQFAVKDPHEPGIVVGDHATLHYTFPGDGGAGRLIYIKKALVKDKTTPADLISYQQARPLFPYDSTGDQFYDVEQFEAYRALGASVTRRAIAPQPISPATPD